jgi:tRNA dimethylallyltransferase
MEINLLVILGPTASGKTRLAAHLAKDLGAEIISADSRQVYRGMDMGTGKDISDYLVEGKQICYHLIDIVDPDYEFNVFDYQRRFFQCFSEIRSRNVLPIMVGGTGLYIDAVLKGYRMHRVPENNELRSELEKEDPDMLIKRLMELNPALHNTTDTLDRRRLIRAIEIAVHSRECGKDEEFNFPAVNPFVIGIRRDRSVLRQRITKRLEERLASGMIDEVKNLHNRGISWAKLDSFGLEYRYIGLYLQGRLDNEEMCRQLNIRIHQFAKRQETWFRRMERQGVEIHWLDNPDYETLKMLVERGGS